MACDTHKKQSACKEAAVFNLKYRQKKKSATVDDAVRLSRQQARDLMANNVLQVHLVNMMLQVIETINLLIETSASSQDSALKSVGVSRFFVVVQK